MVLLEYVLNVVEDEFPWCGAESAIANFAVLQRQILADQRQRDRFIRQVAYQPLKGVVNLAVLPVIAHAVGIAVTAGQATGIAVAVIVALPVFRAIEHHVFQDVTQP